MSSDLALKATTAAPDSDNSQATTVRFIEGEGGCSMLEVETSERSGFMQGLSLALLRESVQIVRAEVKRVSGGVVDRFTIAEHDGSPIRAAKRLALQVAVMNAVDLAS
jgi:UTP:GlnB (protein PII) uridylyltransferase